MNIQTRPVSPKLASMKNYLVGFSFASFLFGCIVFIISLSSTQESIEKATAFFTIVNDSDFLIEKATLNHEFGELTIINLEKGQTAYLGFPNNSENVFTLYVKLENNTTLKTEGIYFEYGLRALETVTNSKIYHHDNW